MGNVWRADRPQRGRFRQFMQCDIDILGEPTYLAEIELVLATTTLLGKLDFHNFTIRINDRRILKAMAQYSGFPAESFDTVFIILDKMDKIGADGVKAELVESGFAAEAADKYMSLFDELTANGNSVAWLAEKLGDFLEPEVSQNLSEIIDSVRATKQGRVPAQNFSGAGEADRKQKRGRKKYLPSPLLCITSNLRQRAYAPSTHAPFSCTF